MKSAQLRYLQPEYRVRSEESERKELLYGEISSWLALEWLYPAGFELQRLQETPNHFIALGQSLEYIIPKSVQAGEPLSVQERWEQALHELQNSQELAADRFIGIKLLKWEDGELVWLPRMLSLPLPTSLPVVADEIALVARRIPDGSRLSDVLSDDGELQVEQVGQLTQVLASFHQRMSPMAERTYSSSYIEHSVFAPLRKFCGEYLSYLDVFSRTALSEVEDFLTQEFAGQELKFRQRAKDGFVIPSHGALRAHQVLIAPAEDTVKLTARQVRQGNSSVTGTRQSEDDYGFSQTISILGRNGQTQDVLADLASLVVDLELYEAEYLAAELLDQYKGLVAEYFDERLFRFYQVSEGLRAAVEAFDDSGADRTIRANRALGRALRKAIKMPEDCLVIVCGSASDEAQGLAETLAELFALPYLSIEDIREGLSPSVLSEQALFDRFSQWCDRLTSERGALVAQWLGEKTPLSDTSFQRMKLWLQTKNVAYRIIRCEQYETHVEVEETSNQSQYSQIQLALQIARGLSSSK